MPPNGSLIMQSQSLVLILSLWGARSVVLPKTSMSLGKYCSTLSIQSAGGHLSLLTLFRLFKSRPAFHFLGLVLNYGAYDLSFLPQARNFPKPLLLNLQAMMSFMDAFCPGLSSEERSHPSISPFYQDLSGLKLPPALFTCGTEDCLLDDTMMMALRWQMNGAEAVVRLLPAAPHGYLGFPRDTVENADEGLKIVREFLLEMLG